MTITIITRICTSCQASKEASQFYKHPNGLHGLSSQCKHCCKARQKAAKIADPEKAKQQRHAIYLRRRDKHFEEVRRRRKLNPDMEKAYRRSVYLKNKERHQQQAKKYREVNKDKITAKNKEWAKNNPLRRRVVMQNRRAKVRASEGRHTAQQISALHQRQRERCACCRVSISQQYHIDHIIPLCRNGSNGIQNIQLLCPQCNWSKGGKDPIDFMQELGFLL